MEAGNSQQPTLEQQKTTEQPLSEATISNQPKIPRTKMVIVSLIILVIVFIGFVFVGNRSKQDKQNRQTVASTNQLLEQKLKIAYRDGGNRASQDETWRGGDLWIVNFDGTGSKKITTTSNISEVNGWSPDNKYIDVTLREILGANADGGTSFTDKFGTVEVSTGKIIALEDTIEYTAFFSWSSNNELLYFNKGLIKKFRVTDGSYETVANVFSEVPGVSKGAFSPDNSYILLYKDGLGGGGAPFYSYNIQTKKALLIDSCSAFWGWIGNKIVCGSMENPEMLIEFDVDGSNPRSFISTDSSNEFLTYLTISKKGDFVTYSVEYFGGPNGTLLNRKFFIFDITSNSKKEVQAISNIIKDSGYSSCLIDSSHVYLACAFGGGGAHPIYITSLNSGEVLKVVETAFGYSHPLSN